MFSTTPRIEHLHAENKRFKSLVATNKHFIRDVGKQRFGKELAIVEGLVPMILTRDTKLAAGIKCRAPNGQALDGGKRQQRRVKAKAQRTAAVESEISMHDD
jgi:hypothetical protein